VQREIDSWAMIGQATNASTDEPRHKILLSRCLQSTERPKWTQI